MIRFFFRFLGLLCLAAAFILVVVDGTKSIADHAVNFTSARALWTLVDPDSLRGFTDQVKPAVAPYVGGMLWDPVILGLLAAPAWSLLGGLGILFLLLGRRKKPLIGYAR